MHVLPRAQAPGAQPGVSLVRWECPACTSPTPLRRTASWYTTSPATVKPPKNLPSLPRTGRIGVYRVTSAVTPDSLPRVRRHTDARIGGYRLPDVANASWCTTSAGNRQTSEEFTVATTLPTRVGGYRLPRVRRRCEYAAGHLGIRLLRQPSNLRRIYRRCHAARRGLAVTASRVYVANSDCAGQHPGVRPVRQPPNLRRIYRRYHGCRLGLAVTASRVYVANSRCTPDSILVYDLSGNRQTSEEFTVAATSPNGLAVRIV